MTRVWPFDHFGLKLVSVGLAALLWLVVAGEEVVERGLRVPLELQQFPAGLELVGELPTVVDVRVRGASGTVARMSPGDIVAVLDVRTARPGRRLFQLTHENVRTPFGVEVVQVVPSSVTIVFEKSATRAVPVVPAVEGEPAAGYVVGEITADPPRVMVTGPESAVKAAAEAVTESVSVADASSDVVENVTVGLLDPSLRLADPRPAVVRVEILPGPRERTLPARPIQLRNLRANLAAEAKPAVVDVALRGTAEALRGLEADDVEAFVDLSGLGVGEYTLSVHVDAADRAGVVRIDPARVQVRVTSARN